MKIKNSEIVQEMCKYQDKNKVDQVLIWLDNKFQRVTGEDREGLTKKLETFRIHLNSRLNKCHRIYANLSEHWLEAEFGFEFQPKIASQKTSRVKKEFEAKGQSSQYESVREIVEAARGSELLLLRAALSAAKKKNNKVLAGSIKRLLVEFSQTETDTKQDDTDALAFHLDNKFSMRQYLSIRSLMSRNNMNLLPNWNELKKLKETCYPEGIRVTADTATVTVQALFDHTVRRVLESSKASILSIVADTDDSEIEAEFIFSWGFDGSTGHSIYNMRMTQDRVDSSLFATTANPLRLHSKTHGELWLSPAPASPRFVRPIRLEFNKETQELVQNTHRDIQEQINNLETLCFNLTADRKIVVKGKFLLTLIDGKCLAFVTGTRSMASCPLCGAKPSQMNLDLPLKLGADKYGVSPLHFSIRVLEAALNLSYRLEEERWNCGKNINARKMAIKREIKVVFNIAVDCPRPGGAGTSNTGNCARKLFEQHERFADVLQLDRNLILHFRTLIIALNSMLEIDPLKFQNLCDKVLEIYRLKYPWARMSPTLHKVLRHGSYLISVTPLPLGMLSEEGAESKNKEYRKDREHHSRKTGRIENLTDIFHRSLEMSDPFISMLSSQKRKLAQVKKLLPDEVQHLLVQRIQADDEDTEILEDETSVHIFDDLDDFELEKEDEEIDEN